MLNLYYQLRLLDFRKLMDLYAEGNRENARDLYPDLEECRGVLEAERDFYDYLRQVFFKTPGAVYAVWEEGGKYISALRLEPYRDGLLLEALETHPDSRRRGYGKKLILDVLHWLRQRGSGNLYSHVHKKNLPSLKTHEACGFRRVSEQAVYIDGSVTQQSCTLCLHYDKIE